MNWILTVLFVGNSLTYANNLPATFAAIAALDGRAVRVAMAAGPDLALIDHLNGGSNALEVLAGSRWDFVVLQQGPTTTSLGRDSLILWTQMFEKPIRRAGARPALFMSWTPRARLERLDSARLSFESAARAVDGVFLPVGAAWRIALAEDPSLELYSRDGFHPNALGSYLAALVIYAKLFDVDPRKLPAVVLNGDEKLKVPASTARLLQRAAHAAVTAR
jgi:hypothetical protein